MIKPKSPSEAPDFVPNPDGMSNLEYDGGTAFKPAPPDSELADTGEGGMSDEEAAEFLARPITRTHRGGKR